MFDVELLARLERLHERGGLPELKRSVAEHPLQAWCDVAGSKLSARDVLGAGFELARIYNRYRRARAH